MFVPVHSLFVNEIFAQTINKNLEVYDVWSPDFQALFAFREVCSRSPGVFPPAFDFDCIELAGGAPLGGEDALQRRMRTAKDGIADVVGHDSNAACFQGVEGAPRIALKIEDGQSGNP